MPELLRLDRTGPGLTVKENSPPASVPAPRSLRNLRRGTGRTCRRRDDCLAARRVGLPNLDHSVRHYLAGPVVDRSFDPYAFRGGPGRRAPSSSCPRSASWKKGPIVWEGVVSGLICGSPWGWLPFLPARCRSGNQEPVSGRVVWSPKLEIMRRSPLLVPLYTCLKISSISAFQHIACSRRPVSTPVRVCPKALSDWPTRRLRRRADKPRQSWSVLKCSFTRWSFLDLRALAGCLLSPLWLLRSPDLMRSQLLLVYPSLAHLLAEEAHLGPI